jgi:transcriptional regulator GlxA family with amidase domain
VIQIRTVGIVIFDAVEVLDACGPFEVFSVARIPNEHGDEYRLFQVYTVAQSRRLITCRGGLLLEPHYDMYSHPGLDLILVPGGWGVRRERTNSVLLEWLRKQNEKCELTLSVCTGAFLLAEAGILRGLRATTHWNSLEWMRHQYSDVRMIDDQRFVDEGRIITSAGISAGIDMSLHVIQRLHGSQTARWTARRMEYKWESEASVSRAEIG